MKSGLNTILAIRPLSSKRNYKKNLNKMHKFKTITPMNRLTLEVTGIPLSPKFFPI